jgi:hypothetical protein
MPRTSLVRLLMFVLVLLKRSRIARRVWWLAPVLAVSHWMLDRRRRSVRVVRLADDENILLTRRKPRP